MDEFDVLIIFADGLTAVYSSMINAVLETTYQKNM